MPAIAVLADLVPALALLLLAFAAFVLFRPLFAGALGQLPVVGGWVQARVSGLALSAAAAAVGAVDAGVLVVRDLFHALFVDVWSHRQATGGALDAAWAASARIAWVLIPAAEARIGAWVNSIWASLAAHIALVWASLAQHIDFVWASLAAHVDFVWASLAQHIDFVWALLAAHVDAVWAALAVHIDLVWATVARYAEQLVWQEQLRALAAEQVLTGYLERLWAQELARATAAEAAIAAAVTAIEDLPCIKGCAPLGDLSQLLQGLEDAALVAAVLALAAQSARDPAGAARELQLLAAPVAGMVSIAHDLVGV